MTLAMMIEVEGTDIKINLVSAGFTSTALNKFTATELEVSSAGADEADLAVARRVLQAATRRLEEHLVVPDPPARR